MRSLCAAKSEMGRRSTCPPPGTVTMTNCPGAARRVYALGDELDRREGAELPHAGDLEQWDVSAHCEWSPWLSAAPLHAHSTAACRSCRQCTCTRGRLAASIAERAAEAPASVVMDATPLRRAVVRIS